jgi:hypothetical protein
MTKTKTIQWYGVTLTVTYNWDDNKGAEVTDLRSDENLFDLFKLPYIGRIESMIDGMEVTGE